ncbi:uncharacterized protein LOC110105919 isoform X1 [Dendrobium catenatum]|uniref:AtTam37 zinc finger domain-containing protein n=1 Tax=Dendrobium catenatum TaxID=906689 RepID=A0A2I0WMI0_9ASPA|nr:uncharacterized protein LOC110105919 isoform X1 [Dendrobium catenatum]PKU76870.1 hypothetical protein MA16_Dca001476 [Dendrobium catenatum]
MSRGTGRLMKAVQQKLDIYSKIFVARYGQQVIDLLELPIKVVLSPFTLAFDIAGSAPRGFGIPELASHLSFTAIFAVATLGTYDIALELGKKVLCQRNCHTCNGWQALRCTMCKGTGKVHYQVRNYRLNSGERATAECVAEAVAENRAELVHLPSSIDFSAPLPTKDCSSCSGTGVMGCPDCRHHVPLRISADDIMEPPWKAYNVMRKMDYPYEHIVHSMKDPKIAAFWLFTFPQVVGGCNYDDEIKQKIWWAYKDSMRYDQLRDAVAKRKPGWEHLQSALISLDPTRARDDPVIVKNIPYYKAKKILEAEVMKLEVPPRPSNWGDLDLPLTESSWTKEELKDPNKLLEMVSLLTAQRELADKILDAQWEAQWRQNKFQEILDEKLQPYVQSVKGVLPQIIATPSPNQENKIQTKTRRRRWWFF